MAKSTSKISHMVCHVVKWSTPPDRWYTLNTDSVAKGSPSLAKASGLIRDSFGRWVKGFHKGLGMAISIVAEL